MVDFFPKPNNKIISCGEALKNIKPNKIHKPYDCIKELVKKAKQGESLSKYHTKGSFFNYTRVHKNLPAPTVTKTTPNLFHYYENRFLAINEVCILCSFPEDWELGDSLGSAWARLGNAVMPNFMKAIAENIKEEILKHD